MSVRNIDLVTFENDSVLNQKSVTLPMGKVSIRQTVILFAGILVTFLVFLTTDNLIISGLVFAIFLGLGLIGSKVMSLDQMIKSYLILLVRGTSLDVKPEYMEKKKKKQDAGKSKTRLQQLEEDQQDNNGLVNKVISELQLLFSNKKDNNIKQKQPKEDKNFLADIQLDDQNILNVSLFKNKKQSEEPINKLLGKLSKKNPVESPIKENLSEHVTILLDGKELEKSQYQIKSNNMISIVLDNDDPNKSYGITATADDDKK